MQSVISKILCSCMRAVFLSSPVRKTSLSDFAGKKTKDTVSRYKPSKGFAVTVHKCGKASYEKLVNLNSDSKRVIIQLHGGGYRVKLIDTYRKLAEKYSRFFDASMVISPDYRTFPVHKFPSQLEDAVAVYRELISQKINTRNIVFIGDSAGANLALASALWLRDNGIPLPASIICFSLWGDATSSGQSRIKNAYRDPFGGISKKEKIEDNLDYLLGISNFARDLDRENPYVSPCFGDFSGFPPVTLVCGEAEMDESDSDRVFEKMSAVGVDAALYKFDGMFHVFQLVPFLPESKEAYRLVAERIDKNVKRK